jgi:hypothetical protein
MSLLQAIVAIVLQRPQDAYGAPGRYIRNDDEYQSVFGEQHSIPLFLNCVKIQRRIDDYLVYKQVDLERGHKTRVRAYLAMYAACVALKCYSPTQDSVLELNVSDINEEILEDTFKRVYKKYNQSASDCRSMVPTSSRSTGSGLP